MGGPGLLPSTQRALITSRPEQTFMLHDCKPVAAEWASPHKLHNCIPLPSDVLGLSFNKAFGVSVHLNHCNLQFSIHDHAYIYGEHLKILVSVIVASMCLAKEFCYWGFEYFPLIGRLKSNIADHEPCQFYSSQLINSRVRIAKDLEIPSYKGWKQATVQASEVEWQLVFTLFSREFFF